MIEVVFYGVRGSVPCSGDSIRATGGNTSSVLVRVDDEDPILLDLGTGLRYLGHDLVATSSGEPFRGTALVSHLHWDHIQGLPFFVPLLNDGAILDLYGPTQDGAMSLSEEIDSFLRPPLFPVSLAELPGEVNIIERRGGCFDVGSATVTAVEVTHVGRTLGFRIDAGGASVVYIPDHQQPGERATEVADDVLRLCAGADLLIHDAQYDAEEFTRKAAWGHSTVEYAAEVARQAGVKDLVLFHHDPSHDDAWVQAAQASVSAASPPFRVFSAVEGMRLVVGA